MVNTISVSIPNPSAKTLQAIVDLLNNTPGAVSSTTTVTAEGKTSLSGMASGSKRGAGSKRNKPAPANTVSEDEDEDFGKEEIDEDDIDMEVASDDPADYEEEDEAEDDDNALDWATLKKAALAYKNIKPKGYAAILASFNFKTLDEVKAKKAKWESIYKKIMAQTKAANKRN